MSSKNKLIEQLKTRILVLDGAMGSLIQSYKLNESDFRGQDLINHPCSLTGNNDILSLTRPDVIKAIYTAYLEAGADIITTNTFNANPISQADYQTENMVYDMNLASARLAREAVSEFTANNSIAPRFVAGSMGPTGRTCSISPDPNNPGFRNTNFDKMCSAYAEQARGLIDGGADILLIETIFDTLNAKAAVYAITEILEQRRLDIPIWLSATISDKSGRLLSGQTIEAFSISISHAKPLCIGLNCALGVDDLQSHIEKLAEFSDTYISLHPNAGLPDEFGNYNDTPQHMAQKLQELAVHGYVNIVGGCCGTTPDHIKAISEAVKGITPRQQPIRDKHCYLSGLEPLIIKPDSLFVNIGERTNVMGSRKFARLIKEENYEAALEIAFRQVRTGAQMIDINMDDPMLDAVSAMETFLNLIASEPEISRVPIMLDSSRWEVIETGLKCIQGKGVVNSISLKDGVEEFKRRAKVIRSFGAAAIVMAFDEKGQADTYERKMEICTRSYKILTEEIGFPPEDIILDPNIFAVATGIKEHNSYAVFFIEACKKIKETLPFALISGGVSNLSFAFRGNNAIRANMHSVFLYHAINAGMDMGIVNPEHLVIYDKIPPEQLTVIEDVILNRRSDSTDRLTKLAGEIKGISLKSKDDDAVWRKQSVEERLTYALLNGVTEHIEQDVNEAYQKYSSALKIIEGPLMNGMNEVGDLFGAGKMFLPQVLKSARVMKKATTVLSPYLHEEKQGEQIGSNGKILLATVKGDVHDIGKNIVGVVLACNNYEIIDLGVMVPAEKILETARERNVDIIGLSGLITPSLEEMAHVAREMQHQGFNIPLLIGGATTSQTHTAVKIAPLYDGPAVHIDDASRSVTVVNNLIDREKQSEFVTQIKTQYEQIRNKNSIRQKKKTLVSIAEARRRKYKINWNRYRPAPPVARGITVIDNYPLNELMSLINWPQLLNAWELRKGGLKEDTHKFANIQSEKLLVDARGLMKRIVDEKLLKAKAVFGIFPANTTDDDIQLYTDDSRSTVRMVVHNLRQQDERPAGKANVCLADFIAPHDSGIEDYIGAFAVSTGFNAAELATQFESNNDDYSGILTHTLADRLAEALSEKIHYLVRTKYWGYAKDEKSTDEILLKGKFTGIRPAPGYPTCPDHTEKQSLFSLLDVEHNIGIKLTENFGMTPLASICGWYFSHPESHYFNVGKIGIDQLTDYAERKGMPLDEARRWLKPNLFED